MDANGRDLNTALLRKAGKDLLSLALLDARNLTLRWLSVFESRLDAIDSEVPMLPELNPPLWQAGHVGWFQEYWIGRNLMRGRGAACDPGGTRIASIEPRADAWFDSSAVPHERRWSLDLPGLQSLKDYLAASLDVTLELLEAVDDRAIDAEDALYFFRLALFHEDMHNEAFAMMAQTLGVDPTSAHGLLRSAGQAGGALHRPAIGFSARRWSLGLARGDGFVFDNEAQVHEIAVPEFEIDSQAVTWAQYAEFVEDGGYDNADWWSIAGWHWVQREGRRVPRHVDQIRHGVLQRRFGTLVNVPMQQPVSHVSWYEAEAWCRWAGRRLPTEVEWELAAHSGSSRGFRWGEVWEWTASTFRPYPGFRADPYRSYSEPWFGTHKVLRGASFATSGRLRHPKFRNFYRPERDDPFSGFRSCTA